MTEQEWRIEFGRRLNDILGRRRISQRELARMIRVSGSAVNAYISGTRSPSVPTIINIAHALDCSIYDLVWVYSDIVD